MLRISAFVSVTTARASNPTFCIVESPGVSREQPAVVGDLGLHLIGGSVGLQALSGSVSLGAVAFFVVAAAGALLSSRSSRALRWARSNPWRFALVPGLAVAAIVFVLSVVLGGGVFDGLFSAAWHGASAYGLTGLAGAVGGSRRRRT